MEKTRKLQHIGDSFYISLPPDWVRHWGIKKADDLDVRIRKRKIIIKIAKSPSETSRKLQHIGDTYYISLPPNWLKLCGLKKGDTLRVEYRDKPIVTISIPTDTK